jgi:hypothetical protein
MSIDKLIASIPTLTAAQRRSMRENVLKTLQSADPAKVKEAEHVLAALDAHEAGLTAAHNAKMEANARLPFAERFAEALRQEPLSPTEERLLQVLLDHPGGSCAELSACMGWAPSTWDMGMGSLCAQRRGWLHGFSAMGEGKSENLALLTDQTRGDNGEIRYTLKPEVAAALADLGLRPGKGANK